MIYFLPNEFVQDEGVYGYLLRVAQENFISFNELVRSFGVRGYGRPLLDGLSKIENTLGLQERTLIEQSPHYDPPVASLNRAFERGKADAVCPECLSERGGRHVAWRHRLVVACPFHKRLLVDHCPSCSEPLNTKIPELFTCECGYDLRSSPADDAADDILDLTAAILGMDASPGSLFAKLNIYHPPSDLDQFVFQLACYQVAQSERKPGKTQQPGTIVDAIKLLSPAINLLSDWPVNFDREIERRIHASDKSCAGLSSRLGYWARVFNKRSEPQYQVFRRRISTVGNCVFDGNYLACSSSRPSRKAEGAYISAKEAASILRVSPERLRNAVDRGDVRGNIRKRGINYRHTTLERTTVDEIAAEMKQYCSRDEAAEILGVPVTLLRYLIEARVVRVIASLDRPTLVDGDINRYELLNLSRQVEANAANCRSEEGIYFSELSLRRTTDKGALLRLLKDVAIGKIGGISKASKIGNMKLSKSDVARYLKTEIKEPIWSIQDVCRLTGWKHHSVSEWCRQGLIEAEEINAGRETFRIPARSVMEFQKRYVPLADLASAASCSPSSLSKRLKRNGVSLVGASDEGKARRGYLVALADIGTILH